MWNKKAELPERWPRDVPYNMGALKIFESSSVRPTATSTEIFNGLLFLSKSHDVAQMDEVHTVQSAIGILMVSVCLSVCHAVHRGYKWHAHLSE